MPLSQRFTNDIKCSIFKKNTAEKEATATLNDRLPPLWHKLSDDDKRRRFELVLRLKIRKRFFLDKFVNSSRSGLYYTVIN